MRLRRFRSGTVITKFLDMLSDKIRVFNQKTKPDVGDDVQMIKTTNDVLTSAWSEIIRGMFQYRIMFDLQQTTEKVGFSINVDDTKISAIDYSQNFRKRNILPPDFSNRFEECIRRMESRGQHMRSKVYARILSTHRKCNVIILDFDKKVILRISSHDFHDNVELVYNPPCHVYPGGHFDAHVEGKVVGVSSYAHGDRDHDLFSSAINAAWKNKKMS